MVQKSFKPLKIGLIPVQNFCTKLPKLILVNKAFFENMISIKTSSSFGLNCMNNFNI